MVAHVLMLEPAPAKLTTIFCISVAEEDGKDDEEVASYGQQTCKHVGHHVANHNLEIVLYIYCMYTNIYCICNQQNVI